MTGYGTGAERFDCRAATKWLVAGIETESFNLSQSIAWSFLLTRWAMVVESDVCCAARSTMSKNTTMKPPAADLGRLP